MYTERREIEDELHYIRKQIDFLWDRKTELRKRLREIDERDMQPSNSYDALAFLTENLNKIVSKLSDLVPPVEISQVLDHISKDINPDQIIPEGESTTKEDAVSKIEKAGKEQQEENKAPMKLSRERTSSIIKEILVNEGKPMKFKKIEQVFLDQTNRKFANFYEQMRFAMEAFPNIKKVGRGLYAYKKPANTEEAAINPPIEQETKDVLQLQSV